MSTTTPLDEFISGMGYETGESRMASESGDSKDKKMNYKNGDGSSITMPIAATKKRKREDSNSSGYDRDLSSDIINPSVKEEEPTQLVAYTLGGYVDHSCDPSMDDQTSVFAPNYRRPKFPENLYAILSNPDNSGIIEWMPHGE